MKFIKILYIFFIIINSIIADSIQMGIYNNLFYHNYLEAQKRQKNIQRYLQFGIFLKTKEDQPLQEESLNFIYSLHSLSLFNLIAEEDEKILKTNQNQLNYYFYSYRNSFLGIQYSFFYFILGFSEYKDFIRSSNGLLNYEKYTSLFPSVDFRFEFLNQIFVLSPVYFKNYQQNLIYDDEYLDNFVLYFYKNYDYKNKNYEFKNYKIHYSFLINNFIFNINHYSYEQEDIYSNQKNYVKLNIYDLLMGYNFDWLYFSILLQKSEGNTYTGSKYNSIYGYNYKFLISLDFERIKIYSYYQRPTGSKWNPYTQKWDYLGFSSIFKNPHLTPQMNSYSISHNYQICDDSNLCEGIQIEESKNYFIDIANQFFIEISYFYKNFKFSFIANRLEKKSNTKEENPILILDFYNSFSKYKQNKNFLEIVYTISLRNSIGKIQILYSNFYKRDYQNKQFRFISHSLTLSMYYFL